MSAPLLWSRELRPLPYTPGMVRLAVPVGTQGAYLLLHASSCGVIPAYCGSSQDLRQRLLRHKLRWLDFFVFQSCETLEQACRIEAMTFRRLRPPLNKIYPAERAVNARR